MELCFGKMSSDVQDSEMFSLLSDYHAKAMSKFMSYMGSRLTEEQKQKLSAPLKITLSKSLRSSGGNASKGMFITLNYRLMKQNMADLEWIYVHELAHIICQRIYTFERGHGGTWRQVNSAMGFEPSRTHSLNTEGLTPKMKTYNYHCGCQVHKVSARKHNSIQGGRGRICRKCKGALVTPSGEILEMMKKVGMKFESEKRSLVG